MKIDLQKVGGFSPSSKKERFELCLSSVRTAFWVLPHSSPEQARSLKDEGNAFFKEKKYEKAILAYTAGFKMQCGDQEINTVLLTNRAAAQFHLGKCSLFKCHTDTLVGL